MSQNIQTLFKQPLTVVNVGLSSFAESLADQSVKVIEVDWRPPKEGVPHLLFTKKDVDIDEANARVVKIIQKGRPHLVGMGIARETIPGYHDRLILHAGPPITWERMCGPTRGAIMGALVYEGLAKTEAKAAELAASGEIEFAPCHHYHAVGPMAGIVSPSMPVFIIENKEFGNQAYATQNEGLGKVLRYGAFGEEVYRRLRWMEQTLQDGKITLWSSTQSPFAQRNLIAQALGVPQSDVRVIGLYVGGGFGSKAGVTVEALAVAMASKVKGQPVKLRLTREEEFYTAFVRQGLVSKIKIGCDKNGKLLAMENKLYWDAGAYTEYGVNVVRAGGYSSTGPYNVPNVKTDSLCVYTNHPVGGPMRGFGMPEVHAGVEQVIDELAHEFGLDPVEFRRINHVKAGDTILTGMKMHPIGLAQCLDKVAQAIEWGKKSAPGAPASRKRRGKGVAIAWKAPAMPPNAGSSAWVKLSEDGIVTVGVGGQDIGQGAFTVTAQMAAAVLGVPMAWVRVAGPVDTQYSPYEWQTVASRLTWSMGNAVVAAARDARKQILDMVAEAWDENPDDLDIVNGNVISYKTEESASLKNIVIYGLPKPNDQGWRGGPIMGRGNFMPTYVTGLDVETGQGERAVVHYTTGAQGVEVEVDLDTGQVQIIRAAAAFDVGKAINPEMVKAQMEGGMVQGISTALFESLQLKEGVLQNPSFVDYRIATSADVPPRIETFIVEVPQDDGPFGARGIGEHPMIPTIPAIANAIYDAIGVRVGSPPFTAEKVSLAMVEARIVK